eukprot:gnl/MRDRNA2_/MRDRNA2_138824_c0_seq1.p1 gnl/MRDRNA2_/MRDRNA2_138824_c0~~gnl/MRDRNA2_/MRDRNA2_138824_c0_seq1.p1  ORF type:complete len:225 (-),score=47.28 gnl/MRDRNA2_/MRDRNA2_138824_c0_seq1:21-695(-)
MSFPSEYAESVERSLEFLRAEFKVGPSSKPDARWKITGNSGGVESSVLQNTDAEFVTVRGRMIMPGVTPQQVLDLIINCEGRTEWDDMLQQGSFKKNFGALKTALLPPCSADIIRLIYKGVYPVAGRDLCLLRAWGHDDDGKCWLVAESCESDAVPVDDKYVRAELRECGYMMTPVEGGCEVVYISQTNFNGWIPSFMNNILTTQQPQSLLAMCNVLTRKMAGA